MDLQMLTAIGRGLEAEVALAVGKPTVKFGSMMIQQGQLGFIFRSGEDWYKVHLEKNTVQVFQVKPPIIDNWNTGILIKTFERS